MSYFRPLGHPTGDRLLQEKFDRMMTSKLGNNLENYSGSSRVLDDRISSVLDSSEWNSYYEKVRHQVGR